MSKNGWIKIHRKIIDNWIWEDAEKFRAWVDLLMEVNHEDKQIEFEGHIITIKRGQKLTSVRKLGETWNWSRNRVSRFIDLLIEAKMVTANRTRHGTLLTIENYDKYQSRGDTVRDTVGATPIDTPIDTVGATPIAQTRSKESNQEDKNFLCGADAQKKMPPDRSEVDEYCRSKNYHMDVDGFMTYYNMNGWTLSGGRKISDWKSAVDYWHQNGKKIGTAETKPAPYFEEFDNRPVAAGVEVPFKGGAVAEMIRRKQAKHG